VAQIIDAAHGQVARTVNTTIVHCYWLIGRELVEVEQQGSTRAEYGEQLVRSLAERLTKKYGRGFSYPSVKRMKQFYVTFPNGSAISEEIDGKKGSAPLSLSEVREKGSTLLSLSENRTPAHFPPR